MVRLLKYFCTIVVLATATQVQAQTIKTQSALITEWQPCSVLGQPSACHGSSTQIQDIIQSVAPWAWTLSPSGPIPSALLSPCTTTVQGAVPAPPNDATKYLNGQCQWSGLAIEAPNYTNPSGGLNGGFRVENIATLAPSNPGVNNAISISAFIDNLNGRGSGGTLANPQLIEAINPLCNQFAVAQGGSVSDVQCVESDVLQSFAPTNVDEPFNANSPTVFAYSATAERNTTGATPQRPNGAYMVVSANTANTNDWFAYGLVLSRVQYEGIRIEDFPLDTLHGFTHAAISDYSNSARVLNIKGTHATAIVDMSGEVGIPNFILGPSSVSANFVVANSANFNTEWSVDSGGTAAEFSIMGWRDRGAEEYQILKNASNNLQFVDFVHTVTFMNYVQSTQVLEISHIPTSCSGHPSGTEWNNAGVVNICP